MLQRLSPDHEWAAGLVASLPSLWARDALHTWRESWGKDRTAGNLAHLKLTTAIEALRIPLDASDADLIEAANVLADRCFEYASQQHDPAYLEEAMRRVCQRQGIEPPDVEKTTHGGAIARMTSPLWWRRRLRRMHGREVEKAAIALGRVNRKREIYASNITCQKRQQQKVRTAATLENTIMVNELGQEFTMAELAAKGPANKEIRRAELMTRIAGFERIARDLGHAGIFITITCPSRMHKWRTVKDSSGHVKAVRLNKRYDGTNPREAQAHLATVWARVRSALQKRGVKLYGFRITEPNHDGTPHWHMLCFHPERCEDRRLLMPRIAATVRRYALGKGDMEEPNHVQDAYRRTPFRYAYQAWEAASVAGEKARHLWAVAERQRQNAGKGAKKHRVDFKPIDWERGSAAGYIAKYIAKNIDGHRVEKDLYGNPTFESSQRVEAWASTWGIRQFQQVGGPPVGPWRELRRVKALPEGAPAHMVEAWEAVNKLTQLDGHPEKSVAWDRYVKAQGGVFCGRGYRVRVALKERPGVVNCYGEPAGPVPFGVETEATEIYTPEHMAWMGGKAERVVQWFAESDRHTWQIKRTGKPLLGRVSMDSGAADGPWTCVNNCTEGLPNGHRFNETRFEGGQNGLHQPEPHDQEPSWPGDAPHDAGFGGADRSHGSLEPWLMHGGLQGLRH